jgi:hypothetical protein
VIGLNKNANNSKAQEKQILQNKRRKGLDTNHDGSFDKKLDGLNQPAE